MGNDVFITFGAIATAHSVVFYFLARHIVRESIDLTALLASLPLGGIGLQVITFLVTVVFIVPLFILMIKQLGIHKM